MSKIVVVDDSLIILKAWQFCPWAKEHLITYSNLHDAIQGIETYKGKIKLLVCDLHFPGKSLEDVLKFLRMVRGSCGALIWISSLSNIELKILKGLEPIEIIQKGPPPAGPAFF